MQRVKRTTAVAVLPSPPAGGTPGFFAAPNPGGGVPATAPGYEWYNGIQEELAYVIEQSGLVLSGADNTLLRAAIAKMITDAQKAIVITGATFEASVANGKVVRWDAGNNRFDEAIADGTVNNLAVGVADVTNSKVYCYGETPAYFAGLTPGARYYLSGAVVGAVTSAAPADSVAIGIAKSATVLWVDIDAAALSLLGQNNTWTVAQRGVIATLTDAATIAVDLALANNFKVTLAGNRTLGNPSNIVPGQSGIIAVTQDATGTRTLAYSSYFKFSGGSAPTLTTTANAIDYLSYYVETATRIFIGPAKDVK